MKNILNITNGDSAVEIMQQAGIVGDFLPWRDVLHDGPVPDGLSLEELSKVRTKFICDQGWGSPEKIKAMFEERDNILKSFADYEKVILWFEHDLYDQLQIIQILDWFNQNKSAVGVLSIICTDQYLGMLSPEQMATLDAHEQAVTDEHLALSSKAWSAFRSKTPEKWCALLESDTSVLPFLEGAIIRQLEEYPNCSNGLSRSAKQILKIVLDGESNPLKVFAMSQKFEERLFMGDSSFWVIIQNLLEPLVINQETSALNQEPSAIKLKPSTAKSKTAAPLLKVPKGMQWTRPPTPDYKLMLTPFGEAVLAGEKNCLEFTEIDHWIGGVHLTPENVWCWNSESQSITLK